MNYEVMEDLTEELINDAYRDYSVPGSGEYGSIMRVDDPTAFRKEVLKHMGDLICLTKVIRRV